MSSKKEAEQTETKEEHHHSILWFIDRFLFMTGAITIGLLLAYWSKCGIGA